MALQQFQFRSDLSQTPLPEVLSTIHRYKVPGVVDCHRGPDTKSIFIEFGNIIFATSTDVRDSLGDRLLRTGKITQEQYDESVERLPGSSRRQGSFLVEMGALQPKELFLAIRDQARAIVWSMFEWTEGEVFFEPGRDRTQELVKLNIPTRQAVMQGVRELPDPLARMYLARVGSKATLLQVNNDADLSDLALTAEEEGLLAAVDGRRTLYELTNLDGMPPARNAKVLYALFALRVLSVKPQKKLKVHLRVNSTEA